MTQEEEKDLLLKDLCARLPYNIICQVEFKNCGKYETKNMTLSGIFKDEAYFTIENGSVYSNNYKPYLFPLSSMTEEQTREYNTLLTDIPTYEYEGGDIVTVIETYDNWRSIDYLTANHFDYRGLIPKGLAIDATGLNIY